MILIALLLAVSQLTLVDEVVHLERRESKSLFVSLNQKAAVIEVSFEVVGGGPEVALWLIGPGDGVTSRRGAPRRYLRQVSPQSAGHIRFPAREPGDYQVIVDNKQSAGPVDVKLGVKLAFHEPGTVIPGTLPDRRKAVVVGISLLWFVAVVWWSSRRLLGAVRRRPPSLPPPLF